MLIDQAIAHYERGDRAAARIAAERVLGAAPGDGDALNLLAVIAQDEGQQGEAETFARRAVAVTPENPIYLNTLGNGLLAQGRSDEAAAVLVQAHRAAPGQADILFNLANAQRQAGRFEEAVASYQQVTALRPGHLGAANNLALTLKAMGDPESAVTILIEAVALAPKAGEVRFNLGNALHAAGQLAAAEGAYRKAIALMPEHAEAHANLGVVLAEGGLKAEAETCFRKAIALSSDLVPAYVGLADLVDDGGRDAVAHRHAVLALKPGLAAIRSSLLMCLQYNSGVTREAMFQEHMAYGALHPSRTSVFNAAHDFSPERRLRIGFISGDFRFHAMLYFALPVLEARDPAAWEIFCYATNAKTDAYTGAFRKAADHWRDVRALSHRDLAALITRDGIDILIDLSGHAPHNRLPTFALKPAPLQVAWGDYVDTRGIAAVDILLGDPMHTPASDDRFFVERVVRFASDYVCYRPPAYAPPVAAAPCLRRGHVTFGSFSEATKIGPETVARWSEVLRAVPSAKFLLNGHLFADGARQGRIVSLLADQDIAPERLRFAAGGPHEEFLGQYAEVDVILDTAPYSGGLTTCEALLMGVPVLTVAGERFCGRHAAAHLINGGYPEGVAASAADVIAKAQALAANPANLAALRAQLRSRLMASPLCDVKSFATNFYGALRTAWRDLCAVKTRPS